MATAQAIAAAAAALKGLINERYPRGEFGTLSVDVVQAKDVDKGLTGDGFGILMWRMAVNLQRRARGPRTDAFGNRFKPSLPIDLSFMIIPYANAAERHLRMLGWVMRELEDAGPLSATQLNHYLTESAVFAPDEDVELVLDPLSVADHMTLWDRIKKHPVGANYLMRMVLLDSARTITELPAVVEREFQLGALEDV